MIRLSAAIVLLAAAFTPLSAALPPGPVVFSHEPGIYEEPFELEIGSSIEGATVYYTLDGSRPDPDRIMSDEEYASLPRDGRNRTFEYGENIDLKNTLDEEADIATIPTSIREDEWAWNEPPADIPRVVTVRAKAVSGDTRSSVRTATFIVDPPEYYGRDLAVWSITTDRDNLFDPERGIYVLGNDMEEPNYEGRGRDWERDAHMELFEDGERTMRQDLGIRTHGGFSRTVAQKNLRLYSRSDYGTSRLNNRFFPDKEIDDFNRLLLRAGSNDWFRTMLADPVMQTLVQHLDFDTQHYRPSVLFLNGEYWGIHKMRDRHDQHFLETHYGVPRDDVVILENADIGSENQEVVHTGDSDENEPFKEFRRALERGDIADRDEAEEYMAVGQFLDYLVAQVYAGNFDWPSNNMRWWRYIGDGEPDGSHTDAAGEDVRDGRWRWLMHDLTRSFGYPGTLEFNSVNWVFGDGRDGHPFFGTDGYADQEEPFRFIQALTALPDIRDDLFGRFALHLQTTFDPDRAIDRIDTLTEEIEPEVPRHLERWGMPESMDSWHGYREDMRHAARERPDIVVEHLKSEFEELDEEVDVSISGGVSDLKVNRVAMPEAESWNGWSFAGVPLVIESQERDLSEARVDGDGSVRAVDHEHTELRSGASVSRLTIVPTGAVEIQLPQ